MRSFIFAVLLACRLGAQTPPAGNWTTAKDLPGVDFSGLSPQQKERALKSLRVESCLCGCNMKVAQCRVLDPACGDSKSLAATVVGAVKSGKTGDQVHDELIHSTLAKARASENRVLSDPVPIATAGAPWKGAEKGRITLVEFSDFQCPYCSVAIAKVDAVLRAYPNDVKLVFKQFPLEIHTQARLAAEASLAANHQGKFWPLHDKMFANFRRLTRENISLWAKEAGLDMQQFEADLKSGKFRRAVEQDVADGMTAFIPGTPTFFINGQRYNGSIDLESIKPVLDAELKK
ncbi:MAG TPA: thioredoxin domain-containing protein [Bryobacteraceae bacterium]|nr:thioredoxin domain-containing protein [Bryobacteraceae bacterium]